jgi:hypothetical protein
MLGFPQRSSIFPSGGPLKRFCLVPIEPAARRSAPRPLPRSYRRASAGYCGCRRMRATDQRRSRSSRHAGNSDNSDYSSRRVLAADCRDRLNHRSRPLAGGRHRLLSRSPTVISAKFSNSHFPLNRDIWHCHLHPKMVFRHEQPTPFFPSRLSLQKVAFVLQCL